MSTHGYFYYYHCINTSDGGLLDSEGIIRRIFIVLVKKNKNIDIKFSVDDTFLE
jgi:hypothetical protein